MFTGLIEAVCSVSSVSRVAETMQLGIDLGELVKDCKIGDSIAVNGACLTITRIDASHVSFDISAETLSKSSLAKLQVGAQLNIERAMGPSERFGGHFVLGHVDGVATIKSIDRHGQFADIRFAAERELLDLMVSKGSVAVDGISLTIAGLDNNGFSITVIPQTLEKTTLSRARPGNIVNIEIDIIVKAVKKHLEQILPQSQGITAEKLRELGF